MLNQFIIKHEKTIGEPILLFRELKRPDKFIMVGMKPENFLIIKFELFKINDKPSFKLHPVNYKKKDIKSILSYMSGIYKTKKYDIIIDKVNFKDFYG